MNHYLMKYKGTYRVLPELDMNTNDFPRDSNGNIENSCGLYITCQGGAKIYDYGKDGKYMQLCAYIPSRTRGRNIVKKLDSIGIKYSCYDETDEEVTFLFPSTEIDKVAKLLKAKTSGASISPFSKRNLPKSTVEIPDDEMARYKKITSRLNRGDTLVIKNINSSFMNDVLAKKLREKGKRKPFDFKSDQKTLGLSRDTKGYIYTKGLWNEYLEYLEANIDEHLKQ